MSLCMCLCAYKIVMGRHNIDTITRLDIKLKQKPIDCIKAFNEAGVEYYSANWHELSELYRFKSNIIVLLLTTITCNNMYHV